MKKFVCGLVLTVLSITCLVFGFAACSNDKHVHSYDMEKVEDDYLKSVATCVEKAIYYKSCSCGEKGEETFTYGEIDENNHNYIQSVTPPTKTEDGYTTYTCSRCLNSFKSNKTNATGSLGLHFSNLANSDGCMVSIGICSDYEVYIPKVSPEGKKVYSISANAFSGCTSITSVTIPDSVTSIGNSAFSGCTSLANITLPDSITSIGESAFSGCTSLTNIIIPDSVTEVKNFAFMGCSSLVNMVISDNVMNIGMGAFDGCVSLTRVIIPKNVIGIGYGAFAGCVALENICVDSNNVKYYSKNNCVIERDSKTLIFGCKDSVIPTDGSVTSIGVMAFSYLRNLTTITIPVSITSINNSAFACCSTLTSINYNGTINQWNSIVKGQNWDVNTGDYTIICTNGTIAK